MSSRVTDLDRHIAQRLKEMRTASEGVNMAKLARFLGITYQSYQAMEKGEVSFRVSTLQRLAVFYDTSIERFIGHEEATSLPNMERVSNVVNIITRLPGDAAAEVVRFAIAKQQECTSGA